MSEKIGRTSRLYETESSARVGTALATSASPTNNPTDRNPNIIVFTTGVWGNAPARFGNPRRPNLTAFTVIRSTKTARPTVERRARNMFMIRLPLVLVIALSIPTFAQQTPELIKPKTATSKPIPPKPASRTDKNIEGWTVHVDDRLLVAEGDDK